MNFFSKIWSKRGYLPNEATQYKSLKNKYKTLLNNKKIQYDESIIKKLTNAISNIKNSSEFWSVVRKFKRTTYQANPISPEIWETHLSDLFAEPINPPIKTIINYHVPLLDNPISLHELKTSLRKIKSNKAPGLDGISNEFFKNLPENGKIFMLDMFNEILNQERVPESWGKVSTFMIYKKGDKQDPSNYRSIALINVIVKIFTDILNSRLNNWIAIYDKLPEHQGGFRPKRSCMDNIFTLNSIIEIQLSKPRQKVFALFVDFRRAFDGVIQSHLWSKLSALGLSKKFVTILDNLYSKAFFILKNSNTTQIKIGKGVLQGERLSPTLFSLLLSDIETFLREKGCRGIQIDNIHDILILAYADDIVLLAESPHMLLRILRYLEEFCNLNFLSVNEKKTEIVIFRKNGHKLSKKIPDFYFAGSKLNITDKYCYLGVVFTKSGNFNNQLEKAKTSTDNAMGIIRNIVRNLKDCSWNAKIKLFDSLLLPTLFYGAHIWAINKPQVLEKIQTSFFKKTLKIPINTPGHAVRLEVDRVPLQYFVLKYALAWAEKIMAMPDERFPKICFDRLKTLSSSSSAQISLNWFTHIEAILSNINQNELWRNISYDLLKSNSDKILSKYKYYLQKKDRDQLLLSKSLQILPNLYLLQQKQIYLNYDICAYKICIFAQVRFMNIYNPKIITSVINEFDLTDTFCPICALPETENIHHIMCVCLKYSEIREEIFESDVIDLGFLTAPDLNSVIKTVSFIEKTMLIRHKILNDCS